MTVQRLALLSSLFMAVTTAMEFGASKVPVSVMLNDHSDCVQKLKREAQLSGADMSIEPYNNDVFYLRFCLNSDYGSMDKRIDVFVEALSWRQDEGREICNAARAAASETTLGDWNFDPVHKHMPHKILNNFLSPSKVLTIFSPQGDPVFMMHHGSIDDKGLMKSSVQSPRQVVEFMLYNKEVNSIMANRQSLKTDRLAFVLTANNFKEASLARGDKQFRNALNESARLAHKLYPSLTGPTLMLNLPRMLTSFAKAFAPSEVSHTMRFAQGPLYNVDSLTKLNEDATVREEFNASLDQLVYNPA